MLIDSRQKGWFLSTVLAATLATALYYWFDARSPGGLTGGSVAGMWFGIAGSLLMIYAGLLSALRRVPSWWWIGSRATWLKGHIWLGMLSELLILYHSGFRWGGPLERVLWVVLTLTIATGVLGLLLQQFLPTLTTSRLTYEVPYEQIPHLCSLLRRRADALVDAICPASFGGDDRAEPDHSPVGRLRRFYEVELRPYLGEIYRPRSPLANPRTRQAQLAALAGFSASSDIQATMTTLGQLCEERRQLGEQERLHHLLHGWLLLHVPLSVMLLVMGMAHAAVSLYY